MSVSFKFEGGRELEDALSAFTKTMAKNTTRKALRAAGDPILKLYQSLTTVASGNLQRHEVMGTRLNRRQAALNRAMGKSEVEIHIGTSDPAGGQEEFGNAHQAAHPSLRPAWDAEGGERAVERIRDSLAIEIGATAKRVSRRAGRKG